MRYLLCLFPTIGLLGCGSIPVDLESAPPSGEAAHFLAGKPAELQHHFRKLYAEGERNAVLNLEELGLAALASRRYDTADGAFEQATARIDDIRVGGTGVERAKSKFSLESAKDFKGEPYERVMAYYYRGLLLAHKGDFQNARAAFLAAEQQDTIAADEKFAGDFWLMRLLAAWASQCDGDSAKAAEYLGDVSRNTGAALAVAPTRIPHALALYEAGLGPEKVGSGKAKEVLTFQDRGGETAPPVVRIAADANSSAAPNLKALEVGDVYFQASTRGGRPIQGILDGKAQFKETTGTIGEVASTVGVNTMLNGVYGNDRSQMNVGSAFALIGMFASMTSESTKPAADTRAWRTLPKKIYWIDLDGVSLTGPTKLYLEGSGEHSGTRVLVDQPACRLLWGRSTPATLSPSQNPFDRMSAEYADETRDAKFRDEMHSVFQEHP